MEETTTKPAAKELLLAYKLILTTYQTSFYFWLTLVSVLVAIFSPRIYDASVLLRNSFGQSIPQYVILLMGIPVGLLLWRYHVNRAARSEALKDMLESDETTREEILKLTRTSQKKSFAVLLRIRNTFSVIAVLESALFIIRLTASAEYVDALNVYIIIATIAAITATVLSAVSSSISKKAITSLNTELDTSSAKA